VAASCWGQTYFGFDKNIYPGDDVLPALHQSFAYAGYWLNNPPQASSNSWIGKRTILKANGFGFMILYNGKVYAELKGKDAAALGRADADAAVASAKKEGFAPGAILFIDQEEGGRLLPEQSAYLMSWVQAIRKSPYKPGIYCPGILVPDGSGKISAALDILSRDPNVALWVANDQCPPSPGCVMPANLKPSSSGIPHALIWQYTQSPRRPVAKQCAKTYAADNNCYPPNTPQNAQTFLDMNVSASPDPSKGR
jgi:Domain of unknown function (DUF1906)